MTTAAAPTINQAVSLRARAGELEGRSPSNVNDPSAVRRTTGGIGRHEISAYAQTAGRGDILPACMRLVAARAEAAWADRTSMAMIVGPACRPETLDMACAFMPRAPEPRLLRAAAFMCSAAHARSSTERDTWLAAARADLDETTRLDPSDVSARVLLAELFRAASMRPAA